MQRSIVAQNTRRIIAERGIKIRVVAEKAGYSMQQFSAMLNNRRIIKDCDVIAIANALEVTANDLFLVGQTDDRRASAS